MNKKLQSNNKFITTQSQWDEVSAFFEQSTWLGLDTEFMRERTYYPQLCLVQMSCEELSVCLDPLSFDFVQIISKLLADRQIVKILHSSSQDIEVLGQYCGVQIDNLFDTQLAAEFCAMDAQIGYAALVQNLVGIELPKTQTRSNWAKRPLTAMQIEYSFNDVKYLKPLYDKLNLFLKDNATTDWFNEEQQNELERMANFNLNPQLAYVNFKASHRLNPQAQQLVKAVVNWREQTAQTKDKPKHWIIKDKTITDIAIKMPENLSELKAITADDMRFNNKYLADLFNFIEEHREQKLVDAVWINNGKLSESQKQQVASLREKILSKSAHYKIPATRLGTRKDMVEFVQTGHGRLAQGWRAQVMEL